MKHQYPDYSSKKNEGKKLREIRWLYKNSQTVYQRIIDWANKFDIFANSGPRQMEVYYQDFFERHFGLNHLTADTVILSAGYGLACLYTFYETLVQQTLMKIRGNPVNLRESAQALEERAGLRNQLADALYSEAEKLQKLSDDLYPGKYIVRVKGIRYKKYDSLSPFATGQDIEVQNADFELEDVNKPSFYWLGVNPTLNEKTLYKHRHSYCLYKTKKNVKLIFINGKGRLTNLDFSASSFKIGNQQKTAQNWLNDFVRENKLGIVNAKEDIQKSQVKKISDKAQRYTLKCLVQEIDGHHSKYIKNDDTDDFPAAAENISFANRIKNFFWHNPINWLDIKAGRIANSIRQFEFRKIPYYLDQAPNFIFNKLADGGEFLSRSLAWNMQFEYSLVYWTPWYISSMLWENLGLPKSSLAKILTFGLSAVLVAPFYAVKALYKGGKFIAKASSTPYTAEKVTERKNLNFKEPNKTNASKLTPKLKAQAHLEADEARKHLIHINYASRTYHLLQQKFDDSISSEEFENQTGSAVFNENSAPTAEDSKEEIARKLALLPKYAKRMYGDAVFSGEAEQEDESDQLPFFRWLKNKAHILDGYFKKIINSPFTVPKFIFYDVPLFVISKALPNTGRFIKDALTHRPTKTLLKYAPWLNSDNAKTKIAAAAGAMKAYIMGFFGWWALTSLLSSVAHIANAAGNISVYTIFGVTVAAGSMWSAFMARKTRAEREADRKYIQENFADLVQLKASKDRNKALRQEATQHYKLITSAEAALKKYGSINTEEKFNITDYRPEIPDRQFDKDQHFKLTYNMQASWKWKAYTVIDRAMTSFQSVVDGLWTGSLLNRSLFASGQIGFIAINTLSFLGHFAPFMREIFLIGGVVMAATWSTFKLTQFLLNDQAKIDRTVLHEAKGNRMVIDAENAYLEKLIKAQAPLVKLAEKSKRPSLIINEQASLLPANAARLQRRAVNHPAIELQPMAGINKRKAAKLSSIFKPSVSVTPLNAQHTTEHRRRVSFGNC